LDDILWTSSAHGTLYVVDIGAAQVLPKVSTSALYKVTGPFAANTVIAANDGVGDEVVTVNLTNGKLTPFIRGLQRTKGLVYLNSNNTQTQLPLNGSSAAKASSTTATVRESGSSNGALIIISVLLGLVIMGAAGFRRYGRDQTSPQNGA
jgi:hypothetical protein